MSASLMKLGDSEPAPSPEHILIVSASPNTVAIMEELAKDNYFRVSFTGRENASNEAIALKPDLVIVELAPTSKEELEICARLKRTSHTDRIPIIFILSAVGSADVMRCFDLGIDDYLRNPVDRAELVARIRFTLKRRSTTPVVAPLDEMRIGPLALDSRAGILRIHGKMIHLTPVEFQALWLLVSHPGVIFSSAEIRARTKCRRSVQGIEAAIGSLRRKLRRYGRKLIVTVRGVGYKSDLDI